MHLSVFMGPFSFAGATDKPVIDLCLDHAVRAAEAGFAMVTFGEQHFNNYEPYCNPFLMAARLAPYLGETWFGTTIVPLPFHHPLRLAEDSNVVDLLLGGRFLMGMSAGRVGFSPDFANFGLDPAQRLDIFAAKLDLLLRARAHRAGDPPVTMDTPWDTGALNGRLMPVPYRAGGPQLAIGTNTDSTIDDVAARGWPLFLGPCLPSEAAAKLARHRDGMAAAGHDAATIEDSARKSLVTRHVIVGATEDEAWDRAERMAGRNPMMDRSSDRRSLRELAGAEATDRNARFVQSWIIAGTPENVAEQLLAYEKDGVRQVNTRFTVGPFNPAEYEASYGLFLREVLPGLGVERFPALTDDEIGAY